MIKFLSNWAQNIIVAVIIGSIIEMILPSGSLKKYVKVVIGIYILFSIVSPIINKFSTKTDFNNIISIEQYEKKLEKSEEKTSKKLESNYSRTVKDIYIENLSNDIKRRLKQKNYEVEELKIVVDDKEEYKVTRLSLSAKYSKNSKIDTVEIDINKENNNNLKKITEEEKEKIKEYLSETYDINKDAILIT